MKKLGFIYKTTNLITGKIYIGQKYYNRTPQDIYNPIPSYLGSGKKLLNSIKKHGKENFKREILLYCFDAEELDKMERFYIYKYDSMNEKVGYNLVSGGQKRIPHEILNKYGEENPNFGNYWSKEKKEKLRNKMKGKYDGADNPNAKKVKCVETGMVWDYTGDLAKELGVKDATVRNYINKSRTIKGRTYIRI